VNLTKNGYKSIATIEGDMSHKIKPIIISDQDVLKQLSLGGVLIAATTELARDWKRRYAVEQEDQAYEMPQVYTNASWQSKLFHQTSDKVCLNQLQELLLWQQSIQQDLPDLSDASVCTLAKQASQTYGLMQEYDIPMKELAQSKSDEAKSLGRWITGVHAILQNMPDQAYILKADIAAHLLSSDKLLKSLDINIPSTLIWDGFEYNTPVMQTYFQIYQQAGASLLRIQRYQEPYSLTLYSCHDEAAEYLHIARQTQLILNDYPQARIAILGEPSNSAALKRCMQETLLAESCLNPSPEKQAVMVAGESLLDSPMIAQLLHLLVQCGNHEIAFDDFSPLLFCPYLRGFGKERMMRAKLDVSFRQQNRHLIQFKSIAASSYIQAVPEFKKILERMIQWQQMMPEKQSVSAWVQSTQKLLQYCCFSKESLDDDIIYKPHEKQLIHALQGNISSLVALDTVQESCTWSEFLAYLHQLCTETSPVCPVIYPNVMVLSMQQAVGMQFDFTLIHGMDSGHFPPAARPQSLLPLSVQQAYGIPMSHASLVYDSCSWLWQQLQYTAPTVVLSYATQRDEQAMQVSSLVAHIPVQVSTHQSISLAENHSGMRWKTESFDDQKTVEVSDPTVIGGGTSIIKHQSACPFRAFAVHRLDIETLNETTPGMEAATKGTLVHEALEYIWKQLLTQERLLAMDHEQRLELIEAAMKDAWKNNKTPVDANSQAIEDKRMNGLLQKWLELECQRPAFQVESLEKTYHLALPTDHKRTLPITIKADRMDKDMHGHRILIDYKTGQKQSSSQWLGERIAEPQLPMYAIAAELSSQDAVSFASVRSGDDMGFEGLTAHDLGIKGLTLCDGKRGHPDDWQAVLDHWKQQIDALALEFLEGQSDVKPRDKYACLFCNLEALCRIDELEVGGQKI